MRKIGSKEVEDIALGAALLGAGGGGDPYIGKLMAIGAIKECGPVDLIDPEDVPDGALIVYIYDKLDEGHPPYTISRDGGKTWCAPRRAAARAMA